MTAADIAPRLADTSVALRAARSTLVGERLRELREAGALWTCLPVTLELGYSARGPVDWAVLVEVQAELPQAPADDDTLRRALSLQGSLAARGHHRLPPTDLLIAAAAERAGVAVLHYDHDFERIAEVCDLETEWVAPPGTLD